MTFTQRHRKRLIVPFAVAVLATLVVMAVAAVPAMAGHSGLPKKGQLSGEYCLRSGAFQGNILGDPTCRNISYTLPKSYWKKQRHSNDYAVDKYPVVMILAGNNMYRNEATTNAIFAQRCQPYDGSPSLLSAANQATYCNTNSKFDQDGIAYQIMQEMGKEFILLEISGLSRYGGTRYDCSPIFGDMRSFLVHDVPEFVEENFRVFRYKKNSSSLRVNRKYWTLSGFSMGAGGALNWKLMDREDRWGQLVLLSPSNNDLSAMTATVPSEPALLNRYRSTGQIPQTNIPVNRQSNAAETAESWGNLPLGGKFLAGSVIATLQSVWPDPTGSIKAIDGVTPLYTVNPLTGPTIGDYDAAAWELAKPKGLKQTVLRAGNGENLKDTVVIIVRGNNKDSLDPAAPTNVVLQSEVADQPALVATLTDLGLLDFHVQTPGDHFTSLPYTFPIGMKKAFELAGSKTGRPFTYNSTIEDEHAVCAAFFPSCND